MPLQGSLQERLQRADNDKISIKIKRSRAFIRQQIGDEEAKVGRKTEVSAALEPLNIKAINREKGNLLTREICMPIDLIHPAA